MQLTPMDSSTVKNRNVDRSAVRGAAGALCQAESVRILETSKKRTAVQNAFLL